MKALFVAAAILCAPMLASAQESLTLTYTTTDVGGTYGPAHVTAAWVETDAGVFVKTLVRYSDMRTSSLVNWLASAGAGDIDSVSGASLLAYGDVLAPPWNWEDRDGVLSPDGAYVVKVEISEDNPPAVGNAIATIPFTKDGNYRTETPPDQGAVTGINIVYNGPMAQPDAGPDTADAGPITEADGGGNPATGGEDDPFVRGGCNVPGGMGGSWLAALALLGMMVRRRRA